MYKFIRVILLLLIGGLIGYLVFNLQVPTSFGDLSAEEKLQRIIKERDEAIELAIEEGVYQCCIEPPCTMCYLEANEWNHHQSGACACDELIAQGKEPCPQCKRGLCETDEAGTCKLNETSQE